MLPGCMKPRAIDALSAAVMLRPHLPLLATVRARLAGDAQRRAAQAQQAVRGPEQNVAAAAAVAARCAWVVACGAVGGGAIWFTQKGKWPAAGTQHAIRVSWA